MFQHVRNTIGSAGMLLLLLTILAGLGAVATATIGAPLVMIPLVGLIGIVLAPFPTLFAYLLASSIMFLVLAGLSWLIPKTKPGWVFAVFALLSVSTAVGTGYALAWQWNAAAGVASIVEEPLLPPVEVAKGGTIALVSASPIFDDRPCDAVCLTLLVGGEVDTVLLASSATPPDVETSLPGIAVRFGEAGRECLRGKSYYTWMAGGSDAERRAGFRDGYGGKLEFELIECLVVERVVINPMAQSTVINWELPETPNSATIGVQDTSQLQATVTIVSGAAPQVMQRTGREGYRYFAPLAINPYAGNAGFGGRFEPKPWLSHFRTIPYRASGETGWWPNIADSEAMIDRTVAYLEQVTIR